MFSARDVNADQGDSVSLDVGPVDVGGGDFVINPAAGSTDNNVLLMVGVALAVVLVFSRVMKR